MKQMLSKKFTELEIQDNFRSKPFWDDLLFFNQTFYWTCQFILQSFNCIQILQYKRTFYFHSLKNKRNNNKMIAKEDILIDNLFVNYISISLNNFSFCRIEYNKTLWWRCQNPVERIRNNRKAHRKSNQSKRNNSICLFSTTINLDPFE